MAATTAKRRQAARTLRIIIHILCYLLPVTCLSLPKKIRKRIPVLQYQDNWVAVNKPAGITMNRSKNTKRSEFVLTSAVKKQLARKVFPVHRLDHRTSGAILFAFDSQTCGELHESLLQGTKEYIALLRGPWRQVNDTVIVDKALRDYNTNITKSAVTKFSLLATQDNAALVLCEPMTGRTHQIRRHAARQLQQPIIGDTQHGNSQGNRWWRTNRNLNRLALHSLSISLNDKDVIVAPLPLELKQVLEKEPLWKDAIAKEPRLLLEPVDERGGTHGRHYRKRRQKRSFEEEVESGKKAAFHSLCLVGSVMVVCLP